MGPGVGAAATTTASRTWLKRNNNNNNSTMPTTSTWTHRCRCVHKKDREKMKKEKRQTRYKIEALWLKGFVWCIKDGSERAIDDGRKVGWGGWRLVSRHRAHNWIDSERHDLINTLPRASYRLSHVSNPSSSRGSALPYTHPLITFSLLPSFNKLSIYLHHCVTSIKFQ